MSTLLDTVYPNFSAFDSVTNPNLIVGAGLSGGNAFTCTVGQAVKTLTTDPGFAAVSARAQVAVVADGTLPDPDIVGFLVDVLLLKNNGPVTLFQASLTILSDGSVGVWFGGGGQTSDPGVIPFDGSVHGIQFTVSISGITATAVVAVDDVTVLTTNLINPSWPIGSAGVSEFSAKADNIETATYHVMSAHMEAQVEDVAHIISYPAGTADPLTFDTCSGSTVPIVVGMEVTDCAAKQITVTGMGFTESTEFTLEGINGVPFDHTDEFISSTEVILTVPDYVDGRYCISAVNP